MLFHTIAYRSASRQIKRNHSEQWQLQAKLDRKNIELEKYFSSLSKSLESFALTVTFVV